MKRRRLPHVYMGGPVPDATRRKGRVAVSHRRPLAPHGGRTFESMRYYIGLKESVMLLLKDRDFMGIPIDHSKRPVAGKFDQFQSFQTREEAEEFLRTHVCRRANDNWAKVITKSDILITNNGCAYHPEREPEDAASSKGQGNPKADTPDGYSQDEPPGFVG